MATALDPALAKKPFTNWLKGALAVLFAREGLTEFVKNEISDFQRDLLQSIFIQNAIPSGTTCSSCTTANVLKCPTQEFCGRKRPCKLHDPSVQSKTPNQKCPKNICNHMKNSLLNYHRFHGPTWEITDATRWCSDPLEIAKCYLPPKGYCNKTSLVEIDFNGTLGIIISNTIFQNKLAAQFNMAPNICSKARDMVNDKVRHSASYELSDVELAQIIDVLRDLLQDPKFLLHDQHAKDAVIKLNHLKNNTLVITAGDITKVLDDDISKRISEQQQEAIQSILDHLAKVQEVSVASLVEIIEARDTAIKAIQQEAEQQIKHFKQSVKETNDVLFKDLKEDIITYYREHESVIPASPLVEEHNVPIEDLYVLPPLLAYKNSYFEPGKNRQNGDKTSGNDGQDKQNITLNGLFLSGNVRYRKIYITANAGFGKTSLSQKLTMTWCQSHLPLTSLTENYDDEDLAAMKYFDLLFLLHLRDYQSEPKCNLDDLIMKMVSTNLSRKSMYTSKFIERIVHEKKCLVILDGLDEWSHPGHCNRKPEVPHNNHPDSCTVLTTTRDWKMGTVGLSPKDIDRRVKISMHDGKTLKQLVENAICILNEKGLNLVGKTITDCIEEYNLVKIGDIIFIPYILLQLMCLFFGGLPVGKSKCEIYSNITEFTLERGLKKKDLPDIQVRTNENPHVPNCMKENETCKRYYIILMKLGKLAFYTLFSQNKESSLIFDRRIVTQYMTEQEIEFSLKVGLLCQTKDSSIIAVIRYYVFFQHKSVQEFFSAIYITSEWQNENIKPTILNVCSSLSGILEMSNVFIFVCGINPEVYACISDELQTIVDIDGRCSDDDADKLLSYQSSMQMQCLQESMRNENASCPIDLYVVLDSYVYRAELSTLKTITHFNKGQVKSLQVSDSDNIAEFIQSLDPGVFTSLKTLRVERCDKEPVWLADILIESARTLKCLKLSPPYKGISMSDISITALTGLTCLQSLYLDHVHMTHSNLKCLYAYISQTTTLTQLKLEMINCSDHEGQDRDCDVTLDLNRLNKLKMLHLSNVDMTHSNLKCLYAYISQTTTLTQLKLEMINCSDHKYQDRRDCDVTLDLHRLNELKMMHISNVDMTHSNLKCLYAYISQTTTLTQLKLKMINCLDHKYQDRRDCDITLDLHRLNELKMMHLYDVGMTHSNIKCLFAYISQTTTLIRLKLEDIYCSDHYYQFHRDCDVTLDLHRLNELKMVHLYNIPCRELLVNPACLEKIDFWPIEKMTARASATLWQDLREAPVLSSLKLYNMSSCQEMIQTIPTLTQLQHLKLQGIDMDDVIPLSPVMTQLEHVVLREVTMSSAAWRQLLISVGQLQHPVTVELYLCQGPFREDWLTIVNVIKTTPTLSLLQDLSISDSGYASLTLTKKTV